jgi:heavy metal sensor kinase
MRKSIRWRLQVWYVLVLLAVVIGFAGTLFARVRATRMRQIDAELESAAHFLDALLRQMPQHEFGLNAERPPPPPTDRKPGPPPRERLLEDLVLPKREIDGARLYFSIWRNDGIIVKTADWPDGRTHARGSISPTQAPRLGTSGEYREVVMLGPSMSTILVGKSVRKEESELRALRWQIVGAGAVALVVGLAGGWAISARILRPVAAISATASRISANNLSERIDEENVDRELSELAMVLNATFRRLESTFARQVRFTSDASHELRTPLAVMRSNVELALSRSRSVEEYQETLRICLKAITRMAALVDGLLTLARADEGQIDVQPEPIDLRPVVDECVALLRPLAEQHAIRIDLNLQQAFVRGDPLRLGQVVTNLVTNAIRYNRRGGSVTIRLTMVSGMVELSVIDTGIGIPPADRRHIFERFFRVDKARSRASGGSGLGLAICQSIVSAHSGTIEFRSQLDQGTTFTVRLPAVQQH